MPKEVDNSIIKEMITHLNTLEDKIKTQNEDMKESEDLLTVNKLDIINLKNEIEKLKMSIPEVSPETLNKLKEMEKFSSSKGQMKKWDGLEKDVQAIKAGMGRKESSEGSNVIAGLEMLNQRLIKLESNLSDMRVKKHKKHAEAISKLDMKVKTIEKKTSNIIHCPGCNTVIRKGTKFCGKCGKRL
jgi:hypothetical protein